LVASIAAALVPAGAASVGNGKLVYIRDQSVFVAAEDGTGETKIASTDTTYNDPDAWPTWSPDGAHVAYLKGLAAPGSYALVPAIVDSDGGSQRQLAGQGVFGLSCWLDPTTLVAVGSPAFSPDPTLADQDLYEFRLDGTVQRLTTDGGPKQVSVQGCAPDGSAVAYAKEQPNYDWTASVVRRDGVLSATLTPYGSSDGAPSWSPGGDQLAFTRSPNSGIYVSDSAGGGARRVTPRLGNQIRWSPDAATILFTYPYTDFRQCNRYSCPLNSELRVVGVDGSGERTLAGSGSDGPGAWSPDGRLIAFARGPRRVVMNSDGSCKTVLPANLSGFAAWQPVSGKPPEDQLICAGLSVSTDVKRIELPLAGGDEYTATVDNLGNETASTVRFEQPAEAGVRITDLRPSQGFCSNVAGVRCELGALAAGASATVSVTFEVEDAGQATLKPSATAPEPDGDPSDNSTELFVKVLNCTILGTFGADSLNGTPGRDRICGRYGSDTIHGNLGDDFIDGGEGADTIFGGKGRDRIYGGGGNDVILARDGRRDVIDCGPEADSAVVDRVDVVSHCRSVYRPTLKHQARAPR
jgi:hypothetical protein